MKKIYLFGTLLTIALSFASCKQQTLAFNENEDARTWANNNLSAIHSMSRAEWQKLDYEHGRAAYEAFTAKQKKKFWKEKFNQALSFPWNDSEKAHIKKLENFALTHVSYFSKKTKLTDEENKVLESFCKPWIEEAETKLGWSKSTIASIIADGYDIIDMQGNTKTKKVCGPMR